MERLKNFLESVFSWRSLEKFLWRPFFFFFWRSPEKFLWRPFFFFGEHLRFVSLVLGLGLEHSCPWPRECLSSERLSLALALASDFFCVLGLGLGLEPCVLDSTSAANLPLLICLTAIMIYNKKQLLTTAAFSINFNSSSSSISAKRPSFFEFDFAALLLTKQEWICVTVISPKVKNKWG